MTLHSGRAAGIHIRCGITSLIALTALVSWSTSTRLLAETKADARGASRTGFVADGLVAANAEDPKLGQDWVRLDYDGTGQVRGMQTAIVPYSSYKAGSKNSAAEVDLIAAVHIADPA